jgi:prepilin-type N-terminal cleavage/methylation domain-containing protein
MNRFRTRRRPPRVRRGVTLIELIVAVTILMLGLLSIVGISATITRSLGQARQESLAAMAAQSRFEQLAGTACANLSLGTVQQASSRNITERYVVTDAGNNTRLLRDTVTWKTYRTTRRVAFQTLLPCRPGA